MRNIVCDQAVLNVSRTWEQSESAIVELVKILGPNSATGTRARVARVRAEYPNQLDYSGVCVLIAAACQDELFLSPLSLHASGNKKQKIAEVGGRSWCLVAWCLGAWVLVCLGAWCLVLGRSVLGCLGSWCFVLRSWVAANSKSDRYIQVHLRSKLNSP